MKNHPLVQAIARVNRVFRDKPGGLIVDYIGIADDLRKSLAIYTPETIKNIFVDIGEVLSQLKEKHDVISSLFYGINYKEWGKVSTEELSRLTMLAYDRVCKDKKTKKDFIRNFIALKKLYALASPHPEVYEIKDEVRFFEMIKKMIVKYSTAKIRDVSRDLEYEISHLISKSISAEEPVDVLTLIGKEKPDISIFDDKFLAEFKNMEYKNYAAELLTKIIKDELVAKMRNNPYRYRSLYEMLKDIIDKYNVKVLDTVEVIEQLVKLAKDIKQSAEEGKKLNLSEEELAFYDLLSSKQKFFENYEEIKKVAREIVKEMGYFVKVADWNRKEYLKAKIRTALKNVLIRIIDGRVKYEEIEELSKEIMGHAEIVYV
jgi:type I restriction enzyme R subunit